MVTIALPLLLAIGTPLTAVLANHSVRLNRIKALHGFARSFLNRRTTKPGGETREAAEAADRDAIARRRPPVAITNTPSYEFAVGKYLIDLDEALVKSAFEKLRQIDGWDTKQDEADVDYTVNRIRCFSIRANRRILQQSLLYMVAVGIGAALALSLVTGRGDRFPLLAVGGLSLETCTIQAATVIAIAFASAYLASLALIFRAVARFDLSGLTFLHAFIQMIGSVVVAVVIWRFAFVWGESCGADRAWLYYPVIFVIGFVPDAGIRYLFSALIDREPAAPAEPRNPAEPPKDGDDKVRRSTGRRGFSFSALARSFKVTDGRFTEATKSLPLDIIDGIDFFTRFRLEEAGIYEVQNLAVANPILLHTETPYGIYQVIDWVAQAQLCTVVGPERYLLLRQYNLRTIFDLERAVLSLKSTSEFRRIVGGVLMMTTETARRVEKLGGSTLTILDPTAPAYYGASLADFAATAVDMAGRGAKFRLRLRKKPQTCACGAWRPPDEITHGVWPVVLPSTMTLHADFVVKNAAGLEEVEIYDHFDEDATIKHMVRVIMDDLHVLRLRQIWESIARRLGEDAATLDDSEDTFLGA